MFAMWINIQQNFPGNILILISRPPPSPSVIRLDSLMVSVKPKPKTTARVFYLWNPTVQSFCTAALAVWRRFVRGLGHSPNTYIGIYRKRLGTHRQSPKPGPFARIITFISYKWLPVYPQRLFSFFFFLRSENNNKGIIALLVRLLKHEIERQIQGDRQCGREKRGKLWIEKL